MSGLFWILPRLALFGIGPPSLGGCSTLGTRKGRNIGGTGGFGAI